MKPETFLLFHGLLRPTGSSAVQLVDAIPSEIREIAKWMRLPTTVGGREYLQRALEARHGTDARLLREDYLFKLFWKEFRDTYTHFRECVPDLIKFERRKSQQALCALLDEHSDFPLPRGTLTSMVEAHAATFRGEDMCGALLRALNTFGTLQKDSVVDEIFLAFCAM